MGCQALLPEDLTDPGIEPESLTLQAVFIGEQLGKLLNEGVAGFNS